jgi:hypothetical protein
MDDAGDALDVDGDEDLQSGEEGIRWVSLCNE